MGPGAGGATAQPTANAARTLNITEAVNLRLVRKSGSTLYQRGTATGTLPGTVTARFEVSVTRVTGSVTFYPSSGGSLTVNVSGRPTSAGTVAEFSGTMAVRSGTGRYARAVGSGTFTGSVNRRSWATTVNARARLTY
ncbi:hypothetical protein [Conexibacter woesei]|uniref:hypothetical protein n=1 Tax=Conexibacter woesei TaxID=191495 RepID=UPI0002E7A4EC|nr:hypothetical protein [Conexibacter woesei]